ncbi:MAG: thioredoxin domain-containing protein [Caldilineaceae bacterium SB0670_bin_27]|nr:thioredoxin domain-containing protein [Caldilineaceae bacterium SB0670_bin_27]
MNLQAGLLRRTRQVTDAGREKSGLRLSPLTFLIVLLLVVAGCTTDADGNIVAPVVAPAPAGDSQPNMHRGVPVGFTEEGYPFRGDPNAPITIYEYSDYECPFCARHVIQTEPALLAAFGESGAVKFVFRDMPLSSIHSNALAAAIAANCMAEQDIVLFWQMHDRIFRTQKEWAPREEALSFFAELAQELGANTTQYGSCMANNETQLAKVNESLAEAQSFGFTGTPSFRFVREETGDAFSLSGAQPYDTFDNWIGTIAAGRTPQGAAQAQQQQQQQQQGDGGLPFWATAEGLKPDPDRPGFTLAGDIYKGSSDAPIVVVEFSDFQCPYCSRHALTTQPVLDEEFVARGEVMWVFKHFPIENIHPHAFSASVASECAAEQEAFWQFHHRLFVDMDQWSRSDNTIYFMELAAEYELDTDAFSTCLAEDAPAQAVQSDMRDGAPFVRGTPTFVVLVGGEGRLIPGALPTDQFMAALSQMLAELATTNNDG